MPAHMTLKKPARGSAAKARRAARAAIERRERAAKWLAKQRDHGRCRRCLADGSFTQVEAAHLIDKGMGGDHGLRSSEAKHFITLCASCHRGPRGVHAGFVRMEFGPDGGDGPVAFIDQQPGDRHKGAA